jgi:hypothetical protein
MTMPDVPELWGEDNRMPTHARVRAFLENVAKRQTPITYQELTKALQILPPHSIHRVTEAQEHLMEEDAAADRPFIAALVISGRVGACRRPVLQLRPTSGPVRGRSGRSGRLVVSRPRAERRLGSLGRFARQLTARTSCSAKLTRPLPGAADCPERKAASSTACRAITHWLRRCAAYIDAAGIVDDRKGWLFRTARGHNGTTLSEASTLLQRQSYVGHSQDTGREGSL